VKKIFSLPNLLFVLLLICLFTPSARHTDSPVVFGLIIAVVEACYLVYLVRNEFYRTGNHITSILFGLFLIWDILSTKMNIVNEVLFPSPESVFYVFISQGSLIIRGIIASLTLLGIGFVLALTLGISLGLIVGWVPVLRNAIFPIAKVLSPIPPVVYTPYVIALMPSFASASVFVIFCGIFWPTFMNMINSVGSINKVIIDSARSMNVSTFTMLFKVIFPYTLPGIMKGLSVSVSFSFMTLTAAEMIGATAGMGFFIQKYSAYSDYTKVLTGIIVIVIVVTVLNRSIDWLTKKVVKWKA
jgi:NitT/TauT family transport system permease protein